MTGSTCTLYLTLVLAIPVWVVSAVYLREVWKDCDRRRDRRLRQQEARHYGRREHGNE